VDSFAVASTGWNGIPSLAARLPRRRRSFPVTETGRPIPTGGPIVSRESENHHISRIDQESKNQHGWYVRMRFRGQPISRFFSDQKYEGTESALVAAKDWRDRTFRELGRPSTRRRVVKLGKPNQGIRRVDGPHGPVYEVTWAPEPGKVSRTTVSINRHGEDGAFLMALKIRRDKEREIYGAVL